MSEFNRMTIVAAAEVISLSRSHSDMEVLQVQWGISGRCSASSKSARIADLSKIAIEENPQVATECGYMPLTRALVDIAVQLPEHNRNNDCWKKFIAGLRLDGFEIVENEKRISSDRPWKAEATIITSSLCRMLPDDIPGLDIREANDEVRNLLRKHDLNIAAGHLEQAMSAFSLGNWAGANAQVRTFIESCFDEFAERFGCQPDSSATKKRSFLGSLTPPFLLSDYNEWHSNNQKPQYVQGLISRLHPHGSHPGLSEEDDCTFRFQVALITARLFLRRFAGRTNQVHATIASKR